MPSDRETQEETEEKQKRITVSKMATNRNGFNGSFRSFYPEEYKSCLVELTPRLSIKRR